MVFTEIVLFNCSRKEVPSCMGLCRQKGKRNEVGIKNDQTRPVDTVWSF